MHKTNFNQLMALDSFGPKAFWIVFTTEEKCQTPVTSCKHMVLVKFSRPKTRPFWSPKWWFTVAGEIPCYFREM